MLEIIGLLFRGTNIFQLRLGIMLIILSMKDIGVSNLSWILELERKCFPTKKDDILSSVQEFCNSIIIKICGNRIVRGEMSYLQF